MVHSRRSFFAASPARLLQNKDFPRSLIYEFYDQYKIFLETA